MTQAAEPQTTFISYSRNDRVFVDRLIRDLQAHGITVWIDKRGLKPGTRNWEQALRDAISQSRAILLVASPDSRQSNYVQDELAIAEMSGRPVIPIWAAGKHWMDCIPLGMGKIQFVDLRDDRYEIGLVEVIQVLGTTGPTVESEAPLLDFEPRNPYRGLEAFTAEQRGDFFGRDSLIAELAERLEASRFVAIVGPSGSGKSSVAMAGLLPHLQERHKDWFVLLPLIPGTHPLERLTLVLSQAMPERSMNVIREDLDQATGRGLHLLASRLVKRATMQIVLLVDQFEELFTQTVEESERRQFIDLLTTAITEPESRLVVALTLRADFYDRPMNYPELGKLIETNTRAILPMSLSDLRDVIEKPAALPDVQMTFDPGLVADLVFEVREQPGALPLLQFTLDQLFQRREGHRMTDAAYRAIGGVKGALAKHAEETYRALPTDEHRRFARFLFLRLIEPGASEQDSTRRRAPLTELRLPDARQTDILRECVSLFVRQRLLTTNKMGDTLTIEVSHEALIREWKQLANWLWEARDDIRLQQAISTDARGWLERDKPADNLYRGTVLEEARAWAQRNAVSADESEFLNAAFADQQQQAKAEQDRQARELVLARQAAEAAERAAHAERQAKEAALSRATRFQRAALIAGVIGLLALITTGVAYSSATNAQEQIVRAGQTLTPVPVTLYAAETQVGAAQVRVVLAGQTLTPVSGTLSAMRGALAQGAEQLVTATFAQGKALNDVATAENEQRTLLAIVSTAQDQLAVVERTLTPVPLTLQSANGQVTSAGIQVAAARTDVARAVEALTPISSTSIAVQTALSIGNNRLATSNFAANQARANLATATVMQATSQGNVNAANTQIVAIERTLTLVPGTLRAADDQVGAAHTSVAQAEQTLAPIPATLTPISLTLSAVNARLVTQRGEIESLRLAAEADKLLQQNADETNKTAMLLGIRALRAAYTAPADAALFKALTRANPALILPGNLYQTNGVAFSPDGTLAATVGKDELARLWSLKNGQQLWLRQPQAKYSVVAVAFSPDGKYLLTGDGNNNAQLWDVQTGAKVQAFLKNGSPDYLTSVSFSHDGQSILTSSTDHNAYVWETATGKQVQQFTHPAAVRSAAFAPDDRLIVTGSTDQTVRLWDVQTSQPIREMKGHTNAVWSVAYSPDGRFVLSGSGDQTARLWDATSGQQIRVFSGHTATIFSVKFSPDGQSILTGSADQTVRLWDVQSGQERREFVGHTRFVLDVAFSEDGRFVLSGGLDMQAHIWQTEVNDTIAAACAYLNSRDFIRDSTNLDNDQRMRYGIVGNEPTCP